jgi:superfamily I DNA and RNA helicase
METIRILGNAGSHPGTSVTQDDASDVLRDLIYVARWFAETRRIDDLSDKDPHSPSSRLSLGLRLLKKQIDRFTAQQFAVLDLLRDHRRVGISGGAGSGKTVVALEKAVRLDKAGLRVLFVCHNPHLAALLAEALVFTSVVVAPFCSWVRKHSATSHEDAWSLYDEPTSQEIETAFDAVASSEHFDAIIVDEGQDFRDE